MFHEVLLKRGITSLIFLRKLYLLCGLITIWDMLVGTKLLYILYISLTKLNLCIVKKSESYLASFRTHCEGISLGKLKLSLLLYNVKFLMS